MTRTLLFILFFSGLAQASLFAQSNQTDLRRRWMVFENEAYQKLDSSSSSPNTIYLSIDANEFNDSYLSVESDDIFFLFLNGKLAGEHQGRISLSIDSLVSALYSPTFLVAIHQKDLNERDLKTNIVSKSSGVSRIDSLEKPSTWFRDFVITSGLIIIFLFLLIVQFNPKLASDYFSVIKIFSMREADDIQSTARITSSTNVQFYIVCSLLLGFYLMILFQHLPEEYALPIHFQSHSFWSAIWQWIRLSTIILGIFFAKILIIFLLTRLFSMRGVARIHFFNWVRVMLIVSGVCSVIVFVYFISRGQQADFFVVFLSVVVATLISWVLLAFLKLNGKSEHSLFHLFSYICATEIIPLLITVKVLFQ